MSRELQFRGKDLSTRDDQLQEALAKSSRLALDLERAQEQIKELKVQVSKLESSKEQVRCLASGMPMCTLPPSTLTQRVCGGILQELWAEVKATKDAALVIAARPTADEVARLTHALRGSARPSEPDLRLLEQEAEADKRPRGWFEKSIFANEVGSVGRWSRLSTCCNHCSCDG